MLRALAAGETAVSPSFADGLRISQLVAAAQESAAQRRFVTPAT